MTMPANVPITIVSGAIDQNPHPLLPKSLGHRFSPYIMMIIARGFSNELKRPSIYKEYCSTPIAGSHHHTSGWQSVAEGLPEERCLAFVCARMGWPWLMHPKNSRMTNPLWRPGMAMEVSVCSSRQATLCSLPIRILQSKRMHSQVYTYIHTCMRRYTVCMYLCTQTHTHVHTHSFIHMHTCLILT